MCAGVIITPWILWLVLPHKAEDILTFLRHHTVDKVSAECYLLSEGVDSCMMFV
jgi:hypothetical protein